MATFEDGRAILRLGPGFPTPMDYYYKLEDDENIDDFDYDDGWDAGHTDISAANYLIALCPVNVDNPSNADIINSLKLNNTYSQDDDIFDNSVNNCFGICMNNSAF